MWILRASNQEGERRHERHKVSWWKIENRRLDRDETWMKKSHETYIEIQADINDVSEKLDLLRSELRRDHV